MMGIDGEFDRKSKLKELLGDSTPVKSPRKRSSSRVKATSVTLSGTGNIIGDGNSVTNNILHFPEPVKTRVVVKTGDGVINEEQKFNLTKIVEDIVGLENELKRQPKHFKAVWSALNKSMRVTSYHQIPASKFEAARNYLSQWRGRLLSGSSAPKKLGDNFRKRRIAAIQARCAEFPDGTKRRKAYMAKEFGVSSMTEMADEQIEQLYRHVFGW